MGGGTCHLSSSSDGSLALGLLARLLSPANLLPAATTMPSCRLVLSSACCPSDAHAILYAVMVLFNPLPVTDEVVSLALAGRLFVSLKGRDRTV